MTITSKTSKLICIWSSSKSSVNALLWSTLWSGAPLWVALATARNLRLTSRQPARPTVVSGCVCVPASRVEEVLGGDALLRGALMVSPGIPRISPCPLGTKGLSQFCSRSREPSLTTPWGGGFRPVHSHLDLWLVQAWACDWRWMQGACWCWSQASKVLVIFYFLFFFICFPSQTHCETVERILHVVLILEEKLDWVLPKNQVQGNLWACGQRDLQLFQFGTFPHSYFILCPY